MFNDFMMHLYMIKLLIIIIMDHLHLMDYSLFIFIMVIL